MTSVHIARDVRIFHKMCKSLAKAGYDTYLVAPGDSFEEDGVQVIGTGENAGSRMARMTGGARKVYEKALALDADLYHFHDPELLPYGVKLKRQGKRVVFDSHEDFVAHISGKEWMPKPIRPLAKVLLRAYQRYSAPRMDAVISVTQGICDIFETMGCRTVMVCNFPLVDDGASFVPPSFEGKRVAFAGGIMAQWNHGTALSAMEDLGDVTYLLAGSGRSAYLQTLQALPGWAHVDFKGKIPFSEVRTMLQQANAGLCLLQYSPQLGGKTGTLGNTKLFECMQAAIPIICTDFTLWREIVDTHHCGLCIQPDDPKAVAGAIRYIIDHPDEARQMGENGRKAILETYNWNVEEQKLLALYESILS